MCSKCTHQFHTTPQLLCCLGANYSVKWFLRTMTKRADRTEESFFRWMGETGKREIGFYIKKKKNIYYREHLPSPVQLAVNAKSRNSIRFISQSPRWKRWPTLWVDRDTDSLHSDLWLTRLHDILLPLSDLIHLPTKKNTPPSRSLPRMWCNQAVSLLPQAKLFLSELWKHIPAYMVCDLTKNQRKKREVQKELSKQRQL